MGIYKLMQLLQEKAPNCYRKVDLKAFSGRTIACDASMAMYQFLITTQGTTDNFLTQLTDKDGNRTGHLVGLFSRSIMFMENGIRPVWVFDGKPPKLKSGELARRKKLKEESKEKASEALEEGDINEALKQMQRTTTITHQMKDDAIKMLKLMGFPVIIAPCEAEAQCSILCKAGKVYATATEDMDALTFQTSILLRGFNSKKEPITEINYEEMLQGLELSYAEFVDLCILCGCDYTETIDGVGPVTAYKLIKEHKTIENVIEHLKKENESEKRKKKYIIPEPFLYEDSRDLFIKPEVQQASEIEPDSDELKKFLVEEKGFSESRVENGLKKIISKDIKGYQSNLESFFGKPVVTKVKDSDKKNKDKSTTNKKKKK